MRSSTRACYSRGRSSSLASISAGADGGMVGRTGQCRYDVSGGGRERWGWRLAGLILSPPGAFRPWMAALLTFGGGMLGLFYANVILGILEHDLWRRRLQGLAAVGRLALTNDLLQTVLITRATGRRDMAD